MRLNSVTPAFRGNHCIHVKNQVHASELQKRLENELDLRGVEGKVSTAGAGFSSGSYVYVTTDLLQFGITTKRVLLAGAKALTDPVEAGRITANIEQAFKDDAKKHGFIADSH
jgi:hypothetical protein